MRDIKWTDIVMAVFTIVIAGAAILQWREMVGGGSQTDKLVDYAKVQANAASDIGDAAQQFSDTAEETSNSISEAADQLKAAADNARAGIRAAQEALRLDQRAWVGVSSAELTQFEANKPLHFDVALLNTGKTPAHKTRECTGWILARVYLREPPNDAVAKCEKDWKFSHDLPPQGKFINRAGEAQLGASPEDQGSAVYIMQSYDAIKGKVQILYIFGEYEYRDLTGQTRSTRYCLYLADPDTKTVQFCDGFNDMN